MTHKFTPGPWQADLIAIEDEDGPRCVQVYGPEGQGYGRVAQVYAECGRPEELWHNVHLVEAAPDLLKACNDAFDAIETLPLDVFGYAYDPTVGEWPIRDELMHNIAKAIKKAGAA